MIPVTNDDLIADFEEAIELSKTYKLNTDKNRIVGFVDKQEAMKQAVFLMTSIERYDHIIYSWNVGIETKGLFGKPTAYVVSELPRRTRECLLQDNRITEVDSFVVTTNKNKVHLQYVAHTIYGEISAEKEVDY
ncbi:MAG: DUF2634 domain-containing protein [Lysinibacillus sp.]